MTDCPDSDPASLEELLERVTARGQLDEMQLLIDAGADVNWLDPETGCPLLFHAKEEQKLKLLLENGADIEMGDGHGQTELYFAAAGDLDRTRMLLRLGADPNATTKNGETPLVPAVVVRRDGNVKSLIVKELIAAGANVNAQCKTVGRRCTGRLCHRNLQ